MLQNNLTLKLRPTNKYHYIGNRYFSSNTINN